MRPFDGTDPKQFIAGFFTSFMADLLRADDPASVVDRYHTPDIVQVADGHRMDRAKLIAHTRPALRNQTGARWEVHEAMADGDRIAARYTLHFQTRKQEGSVEVHFFGQFADDGRMRRGHMLTRAVPAKAGKVTEDGIATEHDAGRDAGPERPAPETPQRRQVPA